MKEEILYNRDYFESDAHTFSNIERASLYFEPMVHSFNKLAKSLRTLDIGCAKGFLVSLFHSFGAESYGVDISDYAISRSPEEVKKNISILNIEKEKLPFPDNYFDLLTTIEVLEHLNPSSTDHLLKEIKRVLKPNGYICVILPTKNEEKGDATHINLQSRFSWIGLFREHNFLLANNEKKLLKKESQKYIWDKKTYFIKLYRGLLKDTPPSSRLGKFLTRIGKIGTTFRELVGLYKYFFRHNHKYFDKKMILFKKL